MIERLYQAINRSKRITILRVREYKWEKMIDSQTIHLRIYFKLWRKGSKHVKELHNNLNCSNRISFRNIKRFKKKDNHQNLIRIIYFRESVKNNSQKLF